MDDLEKKAIKVIRETLDVEKKESLDESLVARPKQYDLKTELLLTKTKKAHKELYNNYVETFNESNAKLAVVEKGGYAYRDIKLNEQYNQNAAYLHELFFANIGDPFSQIMVDSLAHLRLNRDFGNFNDWQQDFTSCAATARSGWVVCAYNSWTQAYQNMIIDGHDCHITLGSYPVIALDMWEHSRRDYLNDKKVYAASMMKEFNWNVIEERFKKAEMIAKAISGEGQKWT